jgi:hypothetical protein
VSRFPLGLIAVAGVALVAVGAALASDPGKEKIALTAAGNAQAKSEVLRRADVGKGWSGGAAKPDLSSTLPCSYHPKQSDLVLVGAAETRWDHENQPVFYEIDSEAQVLKTAAMLKRDWRRSVLAPQVLPCLRQAFKKSLGSMATDLSVRRIAFSRLTTYTRAFRFHAKVGSGASTEPVNGDFVLLGAGRSELALTLTAIRLDRTSLRIKALRMARVLAHRMRS